MADHLEATQCHYALSVFLPESHTARAPPLTPAEALHLLNVPATAPLAAAVTKAGGRSMLLCLVNALRGEAAKTVRWWPGGRVIRGRLGPHANP